MGELSKRAWSSLAKKFLSALTGLALCGFVLAHLAGNLLLLTGPDALNEYTHYLTSLGHGAFLPVAEVGLLVLFVTHAIAGVQVTLDKRRARPRRNVKVANAGGASRKTLSSRTMILSGALLLIFVIVHVWMFRLGPSIEDGYVTTVGGEQARDLYRLVVEWFQVGPVVGAYVAAMVLLGIHLRHGFWSAFQSLGATNPRYLPLITAAGVIFAMLMAIGFLFLPIYIYLFVEMPVGPAASAGGLS